MVSLPTWYDPDRIPTLYGPAVHFLALKNALGITTLELSLPCVEVADKIFQAIAIEVLWPAIAKGQTLLIS